MKLFFVALLLAAGAYFLWGGSEEPVPVRAANGAELASELPAAAEGVHVTILNYHKVDNMHHSLAVRPGEFIEQMARLKAEGYTSITPDELYAALSGEGTLPPRPVLITFDDGYRDNYINAFPILKEYGFKATIFVVTSFIGKKEGYLTWDEAREMADYGISIESHTVTHGSMTEMSDETLRAELVDSKAKIEKELGGSADFIAYPTGTYNLHIANLVREAGYKAAFTIKFGSAGDHSNVYALERVPVFQTEKTERDFLSRLKYLPLLSELGWKMS